jgi:hypothetical protein
MFDWGFWAVKFLASGQLVLLVHETQIFCGPFQNLNVAIVQHFWGMLKVKTWPYVFLTYHDVIQWW